MIAKLFGFVADLVRKAFDAVPKALGAVTTVGVLGAITALVGALQQKFVTELCVNATLPVSLARVEVTFSGTRFLSFLNAEGACKDRVLNSLVTWDLLFPVAYGLFFTALFLWAERWRRFDSNDAALPTDRSVWRDIFVIAPLVAAALDVFAENVPLWIAGRIVLVRPEGPVAFGAAVLVIIGSVGATLKWLLLLLSAGGAVYELASGPRGRELWRMRFSALALLVGGVPLLAIPQGQDILQRVFEDVRPFWAFFASVPPVIGAAIAIWYCARKLSELQLATEPVDPESDHGWTGFFGEQLPRLFGILLLASTGLAYAKAALAAPVYVGVAAVDFFVALLIRRFFAARLAAFGKFLIPRAWRNIPGLPDRVARFVIAAAIALILLYDFSGTGRVFGVPDEDDAWTQFYLRLAAYLCLVSAWLFHLFVRFRREIAHARAAQGSRATAMPYAPPLRKVDVRAISVGVKRGVIVATIVSLAFLAAFTFVPVPFARAIGPLWVLSIFMANAVFVGSVSVWIGSRFHVPTVTAAVLVALLFSLWNDNHRVRTVDSGATPNQRATVDAMLQAWPHDNDRVVLVAGAGGGLRAAYWTAMALAVIQDRVPQFKQHVFAFSGVSGGSLGGMLFAAMARDAGQGAPQCSDLPDGSKYPTEVSGPYAKCVRRFMADDHLSPVLAKLLAPDLTQWLLPVRIEKFDRSTALEGSWASSYASTIGHETFREGLAQFAADARTHGQMPLLLLNTTHVQSGRRYVSSTARDTTAGMLHNTGDALAILKGDVRVAAAIHNSARFTYISPAGHLDRLDGVEHGHVVDGGYFENSGLVSLRETYDWLALRGVKPYVLYLCNDPGACNSSYLSPGPDDTFPAGVADEVLSPVRALYETRNARGSLAEATLRARAGDRFLQLDVCNEAPATSDTESDRLKKAKERIVSPPLGWLLSRLARNWMDLSLTSKSVGEKGSTCYQRNAAVIAALEKVLTSPVQPPVADEAAIGQIVAEQANAWNAGDGAAYARHMTPDVAFTNLFGMVMYGAPAFEKRHIEILASFYKGTTKKHTIRRIRFVTSDVAIVDIDNEVRGVKTMPAGIAVPPDGVIKTQLMEVFVRREGRWLVEAYHNVDVKPSAATQ